MPMLPDKNKHEFPEGDLYEHLHSPYCLCKPQMQTIQVPNRGYYLKWVHRMQQHESSLEDIIEDWINGAA